MKRAINRHGYDIARQIQWGWLVLLCMGFIVPTQAGVFEDVASLTEQVVALGNRDQFPAVTNPTWVGATEVDYLAEDDLVLGVYLNGVAKAYPENLGWWHEVINDEIAGQFISVTYCPLTGTGLNYNTTTQDGEQIELGVSGLLLNSNLVVYDRGDGTTLFPQMLFTGINGARTGERLELLPVVETTWALWKQFYPTTLVPQGGTGLQRYSTSIQNNYPVDLYRNDPYSDYRNDHESIPFPPVSGVIDRTFPAKAVVLGLCYGEQRKAYAFGTMGRQLVINDILDDLFVVIVFDAESKTAIPYKAELDGQAMAFYQVDPLGDLPLEFKDAETGSRWNMLGQAIDGPLQGRQLEQIPAYNAMWFAWAAFWPQTQVWEGEGVFDEIDTAVTEELAGVLPAQFSLEQNFPNPFNAQTRIQYRLAVAARIRLVVYDMLGQQVRILAAGQRAAGTYATQWDGLDDDGRQVASGTYVYRLATEENQPFLARHMVLVR